MAARPPRRRPSALDTTVVKSWKAPIALGDLHDPRARCSPCSAPRTATTTFRLSTAADVIQLPEITVPTHADRLWSSIVLLALATAYSAVPRVVASAACRSGSSSCSPSSFLSASSPGPPRARRSPCRPAVRLAEPRASRSSSARSGGVHRRAGRRDQHRDRGPAARRRLHRGGRRDRSPVSPGRRPGRARWSPACSSASCSPRSRSSTSSTRSSSVSCSTCSSSASPSFLYSQVLAPERAGAEHAAAASSASHPAAQRDPDHRAGAVPPDHHRLPHVRRRRRWSGSGCSTPGGACACAPSASTRRPPTPSASR